MKNMPESNVETSTATTQTPTMTPETANSTKSKNTRQTKTNNMKTKKSQAKARIGKNLAVLSMPIETNAAIEFFENQEDHTSLPNAIEI